MGGTSGNGVEYDGRFAGVVADVRAEGGHSNEVAYNVVRDINDLAASVDSQDTRSGDTRLVYGLTSTPFIMLGSESGKRDNMEGWALKGVLKFKEGRLSITVGDDAATDAVVSISEM